MSGLLKAVNLTGLPFLETCAIYMSFKKLSFYLVLVDITLRGDYLPLQRSLEKNILNSKVSNWVMEIEQYWIKFNCIKGIQKFLADTMSRLAELDLNMYQDPEP